MVLWRNFQGFEVDGSRSYAELMMESWYSCTEIGSGESRRSVERGRKFMTFAGQPSAKPSARLVSGKMRNWNPRLSRGRENLRTQCSLRREIAIPPRGYPGIPAGFQVRRNPAASPAVDADRSMVPFRQPRNLRQAHRRALFRGPRHQREEPRSTDDTFPPLAGNRNSIESSSVSANLFH